MANLNPTLTSQINSTAQPVAGGMGSAYLLARVTHVVTGPYYEGTQIPDPNYTNPSDLGKITYQLLDGTQNRTLQSSGNPPAKPLNSAVKQYPVEGEFVNILVGPSTGLNDNRNFRDYYYTLPFDLWGASHHNALPDLGDYGVYVNQTVRSYSQSEGTNQPVNVSPTSSVSYPLGPNFPEQSTIKSLRQFAGDVTVEGRWGNSIRFGSTSAINKDANYWSKDSTPGNPITIIRNGQGRQLDDTPWLPTVENINRDPSSIYLTQGQRIVVDDIQNNFSLTSLQVNLQSAITVSIPIQQQLFAIDSLSPAEQDKRASKIANPNV